MVICLGLVKANDVAGGSCLVTQVCNFGAEAGVFSNVPERHKTFLVSVEFMHGPGGQMGIDQVCVHLTIRVHG